MSTESAISLQNLPSHPEYPFYRFDMVDPSIIEGTESICYQNIDYYVYKNVQFQMCIANNEVYLKEKGTSITKLLLVRHYYPACRVLHLLYWMLTKIHVSDHHNYKDAYFVDVGGNIASCSLHLASLGLPVVAWSLSQIILPLLWALFS
jgi:hypothetical protein